jgi:uncharacterized repeat protein (TIGR01451 family)
MRRSVWKFNPQMNNRSLSATLSFILSTALVFLPVLPVTAAGERSVAVVRGDAPASAAHAAAPAAEPAPALAAPLAPSLTATKTDSFTDDNGDGKAEPGQTITYTVTVTNNGSMDATGVVFNDTVDPNTTLVGQVQTQPIAGNDSYNVLGNVRIQPGAAHGLLGNDCDPGVNAPCSNAGLTASGPSSSAQGGNVTVNPDGSFSYNPKAGFQGTDSFTYTVTDTTGQTDTATVTLNVNGMVWFVDNTAAAGGDGRLTSPFDGLGSLNGAGGAGDPDAPGDVIFVHRSGTSYGGGIALENGQRLIGQGIGLDAALTAFGINVPPHSDARPAATGNPELINTGGNVITLASGNTVAYLNAAASVDASSAIFGSAVGGTTTISNAGLSADGLANGLSLVNMAGPASVMNSTVAGVGSGTAVLVNGGAANISFNGTSVSQNGGRVVYIHNRAGGLLHFNNTSAVTGTGGTFDAISLFDNSGGAVVSFDAAVHLNIVGSGAAGLISDGGDFTLNMSNNGNTVNSMNGPAVNIQALTAHVKFATTFSNNSPGHGVRVHDVSGSASFGNTTVSNSALTGVSLEDNSAPLTFTDLDIAPASGQRALHAVNNTGSITSSSGEVSATNATAVEISGPSAASRTPLNVQLTSVSASGGANGIALTNTSAAGSTGGFRITGTASGSDRCGGHINKQTNTIIAPVAGECTGGSIINTTGAGDPTPSDNPGVGVRLANADSVSLSRVHVGGHANFAIYGSNVNGFTLSNSLVDGANGDGDAADENAVTFAELFGSASIASSSIGGGREDNLRVENSSGSLDLVVAHSDFGATHQSFGEDAIAFSGAGGAVMKLTVDNSRLRFGRSDLLQARALNSTAMQVVVLNSILDNDHPNTLSGGGGILLEAGSPLPALSLTFNLSGNTFRDALGHAVNIYKGPGAGAVSGTISGNVIGIPNLANSGSAQASGIAVDGDGAGAVTVNIVNNQIRNYNNDGINLNAGSLGTSNVALNATVVGNIVEQPGQFGSNALELVSGTNSGNVNQVCLDARGNTFENGGSDANFEDDVNLRHRFATTVRLPGYTGAQFDTNAVANFVAAQNPGNETVIAATSAAGGGYQNTSGGAACAVAAAPAATALAAFDVPAAVDAPATGGVQLAATQAVTGAAQGFSADDLFAGGLASLSLGKVRRGFAYSERARALKLDTGAAQPEAARAVYTSAAAVSNGSINVQIGTLRAGDSVTITFEVKVADQVAPNSPFNSAAPQVSNQGTVTADGGVSVQTDDPDAQGAANPTVTQLLLPPTVGINDGAVAEPATNTANALFTVTLSYPYTHPVTVNFSTADGGATPATAGDDYESTSGSVTFAAGQTVQTVSVPVKADLEAGEGSETFLVNLSGASGGFIGNGQAVGTINDPSVPSPVIISELRTSGPAGSADDFVELLNTTDQPITIVSSDNSAGWSIVKSGNDCTATPAVVGVIPNGTVIPARGNYLLAGLPGQPYSLANYAAADATLSADIEDDRNVGLFTTAEISNISSATLYDAVGFGENEGNNCDLLREGTNLPAAQGSTAEHSYVRKVTKGLTHDTGDNSADFVLVSTTPAAPVGAGTPTLGAPGPENSAGPRGPVPCSAQSGSTLFGRALLDSMSGVGDDPNFLRNPAQDVVNNSSFGTIEFRRTFTNNTGTAVSALRFRIVDLSTFPAQAGTADLRARTSTSISVVTSGGTKVVRGTTLQSPPTQANGGGINSTLAVGTITMAAPLAAGAPINLRFLFGVEQTGDYDIAIVIESSPGSGKDIWRLTGHTQEGGHTDRGCNRPPVANAGVDQTAECSGGQGSVTLNGSASSDPDGDTPLTYEWFEGGNPLGTGQTRNVTLPLGSHVITLKVTDPSGDSSEDTVTINVVDTAAPVVTPPTNVVVYTGPDAASCGTKVDDATLGAASAADACQGPGLTVTRTGVPAGNFFPIGTTLVTYSATDAAGNTSTATQSVTVIDNTKPVVMPPADKTVPNDPDSCSAMVDPGTATATDNCPLPANAVSGARSDKQPLNAAYPVGTTTITWTATDAAGNTSTATQTITVQDTQAPAVSSSVAVTMMGHPFNHALINVGLAATATDNCPGLGPVQVSVYSDEDDGAAPHSPDAFDIGLATLRLRRERDGNANGRVYLIVLKATDAWGNTGSSCRTVTVPLSNSAAHINAVNAQAAAAASFCSANNGAAPSGFFVVGP